MNKKKTILLIILMTFSIISTALAGSYINNVKNYSYYSQKEKYRTFKTDGVLVSQKRNQSVKKLKPTKEEIVTSFFVDFVKSVQKIKDMKIEKDDNIKVTTYWEEGKE